MPPMRHFGPIPGVPVGTLFPSRAALAVARIHPPTVAGISGGAAEGADSIVLNGGYEDDEDYGDEVIYTGGGSNDPVTHRQIADQTLTGRNRGLAKSHLDGLPVRVSRGSEEPSGFGPPIGFRYDGLYAVRGYWSEVGRSGFKIWRFWLVRDDSAPAPWATETSGDVTNEGGGDGLGAERRTITIQRLVRNSAVVQQVKYLHGYQCQICSTRLETPGGPYAEGAHIRPLGGRHRGPDEPSNVLCLCPNDHVLFDAGALVVREDLVVVERTSGRPIGPLRTARGHAVSAAQLAYHRGLFI